MAVSLETRAPLLDHELAELAAKIPTEHLVDRRSGKKLLKRVARDLVPASAVDRTKMGFGIPIDLWFRAELRPMLEDLLLDHPRTGELYLPGAINSILEEHWSEKLNWCYAIWTHAGARAVLEEMAPIVGRRLGQIETAPSGRLLRRARARPHRRL